MQVLKFLMHHSKKCYLYLLGLFIAVCLIAFDNAVKPFLFKNLIDAFSPDNQQNPWIVLIYYTILQFIMVIAWIIVDYCTLHYINNFRLNITDYFIKRFYNYSYSFFQTYSTGNLLSKFNDVFRFAPGLVQMTILQFIRFILLISIAMFLLNAVAPIFVKALLAWITVFFTITALSIKKGIMYSKNNAAAKSELMGFFSDYIGNILNVKTFVTQDHELLQASKLKQNYLSVCLKQGNYFVKFYALQGVLTSIYIIGFIISLIYGYQESKVTAGSFTLVVMLNFNIINMVYEIAYSLREFVVNWGTVAQSLITLEDSAEIKDNPSSLEFKILEGEIVFKSVKFHYKDSSPLFENKSVTINSKEKVGLVGYSGSGKTTFANLILRLYDITDGNIIIDQQDINDISQDSLRKNISMIPQEPVLFHRSIMDNIRYGKIDASDEEVIEAAKKAHADEFISKLPKGYNTVVGERGIKLSGGQRQRIAIARAILKNAPILILDEATSQLDSITESYIQSSLHNLMQNKTTIVIAHRLSTLLYMDRILVFDQGKIVQDGPHKDLLKEEGLYKTMWDAQSGGILPDKQIT